MSKAHYDRIEQAIRYIEDHQPDQPDLAEIAAGVGLSPHHLQRLFTAWAGVSPKQFLRYLTLDHAREALRGDRSVLDAAYDAGLSGPGRLHDLFVTFDALTPGEARGRGRGLEIRYGLHDSAFGHALVGLTARGICWVSFHGSGEERIALAGLQAEWPEAALVEDRAATWAAAGQPLADGAVSAGRPLRLWAAGTNFQIKVWEALLRIPTGRLATYSDIARAIGRPAASRAVGGAVGSNPISLLIPCHRVIRSTGRFETGYRWGAARKRALIAWEASAGDRAAQTAAAWPAGAALADRIGRRGGRAPQVGQVRGRAPS